MNGYTKMFLNSKRQLHECEEEGAVAQESLQTLCLCFLHWYVILQLLSSFVFIEKYFCEFTPIPSCYE